MLVWFLQFVVSNRDFWAVLRNDKIAKCKIEFSKGMSCGYRCPFLLRTHFRFNDGDDDDIVHLWLSPLNTTHTWMSLKRVGKIKWNAFKPKMEIEMGIRIIRWLALNHYINIHLNSNSFTCIDWIVHRRSYMLLAYREYLNKVVAAVAACAASDFPACQATLKTNCILRRT